MKKELESYKAEKPWREALPPQEEKATDDKKADDDKKDEQKETEKPASKPAPGAPRR